MGFRSLATAEAWLATASGTCSAFEVGADALPKCAEILLKIFINATTGFLYRDPIRGSLEVSDEFRRTFTVLEAVADAIEAQPVAPRFNGVCPSILSGSPKLHLNSAPT